MKIIKQILSLHFVAFMFFAQITIAPAYAQSPPDIEAFFPKPKYGGIALSPSGGFLAFPDYRGPDHELVIVDLQHKKEVKRIKTRGRELNWVKWATEDRLLAGVSYMVDGYIKGERKKKDADGNTYWVQEVKVHRVMAINKNGKERIFLFDNANDAMRRYTGLAKIENMLPNDPNHILMPAYDNGYGLWKVNIKSGALQKVEHGTPNTFDWKTDQKGKAVVRYDRYNKGRLIKIFARSPNQQDWQNIAKIRQEDLAEFNPIAPSNDPNIYYVSARPNGHDKIGIYRYDLNKRKFNGLVSKHKDVDLHSALIDDNGHYYGSVYFEDRYTYDFVDDNLNNHMKGLNSFFGNENNILVADVSSNGLVWILYVSGPREPGSYYSYNTKHHKAEFLLSENYELDEKNLNKMEVIKFTARDGFNLSGYLTLPKHPQSHPAPLLVLPHGGPQIRDYYTYNRIVQYFASRGYQIFQPNFRGSRGFGKKFEEAGYKEWGGKMQEDVTDGVKHLIKNSQANKDRICIMGLSYGGFSALSGTVTTPNMYQCVISVSGVTDLRSLIKYDLKRFKGSDSLEKFVKDTIGDLKSDKEIIKIRSPINNIDKINTPILLIHGNRDEVVPVEQSRNFYLTMKKAGKDISYIELSGTNHNLINVRNKDPQSDTYYDAYKETLLSVEDFLLEHLKP